MPEDAQTSPAPQERPKRKHIWVLFALMACLFFSWQDFLSALAGGLVGNPSPVIIIGLVMGTFGICFGIFVFIRGRFKGITKKAIIFGCFAGCFTLGGVASLQAGFIMDPKSVGPIVAMSSPACILTGVLSFIFLKERLHWAHLVGIGGVVVGLIMVALANQSSAPAWLGVMFGLIALVLFGFAQFWVKCSAQCGADPLAMMSIMMGCNFPIAFVFLLIFLVIPSPARVPFVPAHCIAIGGGVLDLAGSISVFVAMGTGPAGPIAAISTSTSALVTIWNLALRGLIPTGLKIAGMIVVLLAVMELSLADIIRDMVHRRFGPKAPSAPIEMTEDRQAAAETPYVKMQDSPA